MTVQCRKCKRIIPLQLNGSRSIIEQLYIWIMILDEVCCKKQKEII